MAGPQPKDDNLRFSATVLLPALLVLVLTGAAIVSFTLWATSSIDARALERQTRMVSQLLETQRTRLAEEVESVAIWDEAVIYASKAPNLAWIHTNIGQRLNQLFGHTYAAIVDGQGRPIYLMSHGNSIPVENIEGIDQSSVVPLMRQLRQSLRTGSVAAWRAGRHAALPGFSEFILMDGRPIIISAMPLVAENAAIANPPGEEFIIASAHSLDVEAAARLSHDYLLEDAEFVLRPSTDPDRAAHPILGADGRFIAFLEWTSEKPGRMMLTRFGPVLAASFVVASILVILLMTLLRRSRALAESSRRTAEFHATHDRLTGLPNRMSFDQRLAELLADPSTAVHLLLLDLDRFKQVNDTLGHQAGDELICRVAERIREIVGPDIFLARIGGDEFAVVGSGSFDTASVSSRIIEAISRPYAIRHTQSFVGVSIGIVATDDSARSDARELVRKADIALYEAKSAGRNRAIRYQEHMGDLLEVQRTLETELRAALAAEDQLWVAFQPLIDQQTRQVIGAEALARWRHPKFGQVSPARFIPVAESTGLVEALGTVVLRRACEVGARAPGRTIAVNISPIQLRNPGFAERVFGILLQTGMRAEDLELEITESILLDDEKVSAANLRTFRAAGIHIALDDFGTGYSSLSYLERYPVDRIKIDRSFVSQLAPGHVSVAIVRALVTLAHAMRMHVTAEGVETEQQAETLGELGCNTLQGFLFSPAVDEKKIAEMFAISDMPRQHRRVGAA